MIELPLPRFVIHKPLKKGVTYYWTLVCTENTIRVDSVTECLSSATMVALLCFLFALVASPFKSKSRLEAENIALRHQLAVLRRKVQGRVHFRNGDRLFFVYLYRWFRRF